MKFKILIVLLFCFNYSWSQCPTPDFTIDTDYCLNENIELSYSGTNKIRWSFCESDLTNSIAPTEIIDQSPNGGRIYGLEIIKFNGNHFGFYVGRSNKIYRINFGDIIDDEYTITELSPINSNLLDQPINLKLNSKNQTEGFIANLGDQNVLRLNFNGDILNESPEITVFKNFTSYSIFDVEFFELGSDSYIATSAFSSNQINILKVENDGTSTDISSFNITGGSDFRYLTVKNICDSIYLFPSDFTQNKIFRVKLNQDLTSVVSQGSIANVTNSLDLSFANTYKDKILLAQTRQGNIFNINFGEDIESAPVLTELTNSKINETDVFGIANFQKADSLDHFALILESNKRKFFQLEITNECFASKIKSSNNEEIVSFTQAGQYPITLTEYDINGNSNSISKEVTITVNESPIGDIVLEPAYCIADNITFSFNTTDDIASYTWDFGDGNASNANSPTHQYASDGEFYISLEVESAAGCPNIFYDTLSILPEPLPEFTTTSTEYCSFESIAFTNSTPYDYGENVVWSWDFNGEGSSTDENPDFIFESAGTKTITLEANVLGCVQTYQSTIEIIEGPEVDFSYDSNCLGEAIQFTNLSTGANITGYQWDFGNSENSTAENPQMTYNEPGTYEVTLTVSNSSGCENTTTQNIQIFEQVVDSIYSTEAIENLPFDLGIDWVNDFDSTQNLNYQWEIDGEIQTSDTVNYTLDQGTYTVNLEITTSSNCLFTAQKLIEVTASENPSPAFILTEEVCQGEQFQIENTSVNTDSVLWDFCTGNFDEIPVGSDFLDDSPFTSTNNVKIYRDGSEIFAFVPSRGTSNVYRASISENLELIDGFEPLINESSNISGPIDIDIVRNEDSYLGFVIDFDNRRIYKLDFGNSLANQPVFEDLGQFAFMNGAYGIAAIQEAGLIKLAVSNFSNNNLGIVSIDNANNLAVETINLGNRSRGVDLLKRNDNYNGAVAIENAGIVRILDFGSSVNTTITNTYDISIADLPNPNHVKLFEEGGNLQALVYANNSNLANLNFGDSLDVNPTISNYGNLGVLNTNVRGFDVFQNEESNWKALFIETSGVLKQISFDKDCGINNALGYLSHPTISYSQPGTYPITLTAYHPNGNSESITKEITVTENQAPEIAFATGENLCVSAPIEFSSESNAAISSYSWDFGDGNTSSEANPAHLFSSAGEYLVQLSVTDTAGCNNLFQDSITVYAEPQPDFQASAQGSICSQKPVVFENTTPLPTTATFQWDFGDGNTSTEENPEHIYAKEGEYIINFQIEMAGCLVEKTDTITVNPGPLVDFNYNDDCFGQVVNFENSSTGEFLQSFQWDFGDGTQSTQTSPNHRYDSAGTYKVQLTALTSNGCDYTFEQEVIVHPVATVAFEAEVGCANQPIQFNEQVALQQSNITDYLWDFGVSGTTSDVSTEANPEFTFPSAGTYEVSLQVTTADGCTTSGTQTVSVNALPQPAFRYEDNCLNNAILFSPEITENIVAHFWELQNVAGEVVFTAQSENFSYTFENAGTYQLRYRQQNENLCSNSITETIEILPLPEPEFQVGSICANEPIFLENLTDLKGNTLKSYSWSINEAVVSTDFRPQYTFEESGDYQIALQVETQNGCIQTVEKTISVSPAPVAFFELEQTLAAYPYTLNLNAEEYLVSSIEYQDSTEDRGQGTENAERTNPISPSGTKGLSTSPLGIEGLWTLNNDTISTTALLNHTITQPGTYLLGLILTNEAGCTDSHYEQIRIRKPNLDIALSNLRITQDQDFTGFVLNISNRGTLVPERLDLEIDLGSYAVTETIEEPLLPEQNRNVALSIKLTEEQIRGLAKICIRAIPHNDVANETYENNNRVCSNIETGLTIMEIYPNPVVTQFTLPIILPENAVLSLSLEQSNGQNVKAYSYDLEAGYHEIQLERGNIKPGIYFLRIRYQGKETVKKIIFQ